MEHDWNDWFDGKDGMTGETEAYCEELYKKLHFVFDNLGSEGLKNLKMKEVKDPKYGTNFN